MKNTRLEENRRKENRVPLKVPIKAICIPGTFAGVAKLAYRWLWLTLKIIRENGMWSTTKARVLSSKSAEVCGVRNAPCTVQETLDFESR